MLRLCCTIKASQKSRVLSCSETNKIYGERKSQSQHNILSHSVRACTNTIEEVTVLTSGLTNTAYKIHDISAKSDGEEKPNLRSFSEAV